MVQASTRYTISAVALGIILIVLWIIFTTTAPSETFRCGTFSSYNPDFQDCCLGDVYPGKNWEECGGVCYNEKTHDCCNSIVKEGNTWHECIGSCYDFTSQSLLQ